LGDIILGSILREATLAGLNERRQEEGLEKIEEGAAPVVGSFATGYQKPTE
jgi:hypothetical protein